MWFVAESAVLSRALGACREVADQKSTIAILGCTKLTLTGNSLTLEATDLSMKFITSIDVDGREDGVTVLSAQRLFEIVKLLPAGSQIELLPAADQIGVVSGYTLKSNRSRYRLPCIDPAEWVEFPETAGAITFDITPADVRRLFSTTAPFLITDGGVNALYGHFLHREGEKLIAVGCNRHILCAVSIPAPEGSSDLIGIVVPPHAAKRILALADSDVTVSIGETLMSFSWGKSLMITKMIEGEYPEYQRIIPAANPIEICIDANEAKNAIKRAAMISDDITYGGSRSVRLNASPDLLTITATGGNGEEGEEVISTAGDASGEWGFNSRYLVTVLEACSGANATAWFSEATNPMLMRPDDDPGITLVAVPMSLKPVTA